MARKLGTVVKGDGAAPVRRHQRQQVAHGTGNRLCRLAGLTRGDEQARVALVQGKYRLTASPKEHQISLPVTGRLAVGRRLGAFCQGTALGDEGGRTAASAPPPAALGLGARQEMAPLILLGARNLPVDKAIDGLVGDDRRTGLPRQVACHLLRGPTLLQVPQHHLPQGVVPLQHAATPAPRPRFVICNLRLVACRWRSISFYLPCNRRWRATQSCSDLPLRRSRGEKSGHFTPLFKGKLTVVFSHGNTLAKCCTSFVSLANPGCSRRRRIPRPRTGANFRGNDGTRRTIFMVMTEVGFLYFMAKTTRGAGA